MYVPQRAFSQATDHWFVVRDARDLTFAFEFVCLGNRTLMTTAGQGEMESTRHEDS